MSNIVYFKFIKEHLNNVKEVENIILNEKLSNNKIKEVLRILRESNYDVNILFCIVNHYYKNNNLDIINNDIINKIKNDKTIAIMYYFIACNYEIDNDKVNMEKYLLMSSDYTFSLASNNLGVYYIMLKDYNKAEIFFKKAIDLNNHEAIHNLIKYYFLTKKDDILKEFLLNYYYENPCVKILYFMGLYYQIVEKNDELMKKYYLEAINVNHCESMNNLAKYYEINKDYSNMLKYYLMAITHNNINSMIGLASYYYKIEDIDKMKILCDKIIKIDINNHLGWSLLGRYYHKTNNIPMAIKCFQKSITLGNYFVYSDLCYLYFMKEKYDDCIKFANLAVLNKIANGYIYMALCYDKKNNYNKALEFANLAIDKKLKYGYLYLAKYYLCNKLNLNLCKKNMSLFLNYSSTINEFIIYRLENIFTKEILYNLFTIVSTNNPLINEYLIENSDNKN